MLTTITAFLTKSKRLVPWRVGMRETDQDTNQNNYIIIKLFSLKSQVYSRSMIKYIVMYSSQRTNILYILNVT